MRSTRSAALLLALFLLGACRDEPRARAERTAGEEPRSDSAAAPAVQEEAPAAADSMLAMAAQLTVVAYGPDDEPAPLQLSLTDPLSRTTGVADAGGPTYVSIPGSRYEVVTVQRDSAAPSRETAPLVSVRAPAAGEWTARVVTPRDSRYRIDVRAVMDDGTGRRASAPWEPIGAGEAREWRITYDPRDPDSFALAPVR